MGSSNSKQRADSATKRMSGETLQEQRRKILEEHGILIPPAFGVTGTPSQKGTGPSMSIQHRLLSMSSNKPVVSYFRYLQETDLSTILLRDHMVPGVWVNAQAATRTKVHVSVFSSSEKQDDQTTSSSSSAALDGFPLNTGHLFVQHRELPITLQLRGGTIDQMDPFVSASIETGKNASLFACSTVSGRGWLGGHMDHTIRIPAGFVVAETTTDTTTPDTRRPYYEGLDVMSRDTINWKAGAWTPIDWDRPLPSFTSNNNNNKRNSNSFTGVHGYAAVNLLGATAAVHGNLDGAFGGGNQKQQQRQEWATYFSVNLNDMDRPPLQLTLERDNTNMNSSSRSSISLCQCLAFDRLQWNIAEDRAPKVRNTLAWTMRMESFTGPASTSSSSLAEDSGEHNPTMQQQQQQQQHRLSLGAAWQVNRGLALKAVFRQDEGLTTAVIMKRWHHPRVACSILHRWNPKTPSFQLLGLGLEVETGMLDSDPDSYYYNYHPDQATTWEDCDKVPQTRAVLPPDYLDKQQRRQQR